MDSILQQIEALRKELNEHNYNYYVLDTPSISDYEFDQKLKALQDLEAQYPQYKDPNSPTVRVGGESYQEFPYRNPRVPHVLLGQLLFQGRSGGVGEACS